MRQPTLHHVSHHIEIDAPGTQILELLIDTSRWPLILGPTLHVEQLESAGDTERLRIWARAKDEVRSWESRRRIDRQAGTVEFGQVQPAAPAAAMSGCWRVEAGEELASRLVLDHTYAAIDDDPEALAWIAEATDRNSVKELAGMKDTAEHLALSEGATFTFEDVVDIAGRAEDVYRFLYEAEAWPERLGHVAEVRTSYHDGGIQGLGMDTVAPDGSTHTTHSYRVCQEPAFIAYKQTETPPLMQVHTGKWTITPRPDGVSVGSRHSVTINPDAIARILGPSAGLGDAREYIHRALSANSTKTLNAAKSWAESLAPDRVRG